MARLPGQPPWAGSQGAGVAGEQQSETASATSERNKSSRRSAANLPQNTHFSLDARPEERLPLASSPSLPPERGAKNSPRPPEANRLPWSLIALRVGALEPRRSGGAIIGDDEEGRIRTSLQAFSGRPAQTVLERAPEASNGSVPPQLGGASSERLNQSSACQSREQRNTGPRTPLHVNEERPRARYDKKERSKCSQVEYDSC
jgi:hypothetical protein